MKIWWRASPWPEDVKKALDALPAQHPFSVPDLLFEKLDDERIAGWRDEFGGAPE